MNSDLKEKALSFDSMVRRIEKQGYRFSQFETSTIDPCHSIDVEWNYKDIAHVEHIHSHVAREFTFVGENSYTTLDFQNLFGISIPQSTAFYSTEDNRLIAHTTLFLYIILVEVSFEQLDDDSAKTTTRYAIGVKMRIGELLFPIIRRALRSNWERFMKEDRPMRIRRGELRKNGFTLVDRSPVDMRKTLQISDVGVRPPAEYEVGADFSLNVADNLNKFVQLGNSDHYGLQVRFTERMISIFPRLCPHRGASLDTDNCDGNFVKCPWHGRKYSPLCSIKNNGERQGFSGQFHHCTYNGNTLEIVLKKPTLAQTHGDSIHNGGEWVKPWVKVDT